jgi:peptidoglycan/LPS O-acetylase OafA/YrhL
MMIGGIFSMWMANHLSDNPKFKTWISPAFLFNKNVQRALFLGFIGYLIFGVAIKPQAYSNQILSILTAGCIVNLAFNPKCIIRIENKTLNFIGKISFGLYLMHKFPAQFFTWLSVKLEISNLLVQNLFIYGLTLPASILLAYLSFHYYETWFLKLKDKKFTVH